MKYLQVIILVSIVLYSTNSCRSTKKLQTAINKKDTQVVIIHAPASIDSLKNAFDILKALESKRINFITFSAKIKVQYEDQRGQQPDFYAFVRLYKDSVLWISINSTFLNIEAFRILIKKDQIIIINKLNKQ